MWRVTAIDTNRAGPTIKLVLAVTAAELALAGRAIRGARRGR
jgi:hypothetical protein